MTRWYMNYEDDIDALEYNPTQYADPIWRISMLLRDYYKGCPDSEQLAVDVIDLIEVEMQEMGLGGITTTHTFNGEVTNDVGDVVKIKNESSYGKLGLAGIKRYRKTGSIV